MNNTLRWDSWRCHFSSSHSQGHGGAMGNDITSYAVWTVWVEMSNTVRRLHTCQTSEEEKTHLFLTPSCLWGPNHRHLSLPSRLSYYTPALHKVCLPKLIQGPLEALFQYKVLALLALTPLGSTLVFLCDFHNVDVGKVVRARWPRKSPDIITLLHHICIHS